MSEVVFGRENGRILQMIPVDGELRGIRRRFRAACRRRSRRHDRRGAGPGVGPDRLGRWGCAGYPLTEAEKLLTARPTPPFHGSNPAWMLVRYHEVVMAPRLRTSLMKSSTLNDHDVIGDGAT
ncbi:hypothetical protein SUDANB95_04841 [Actinosynnema sp. ALI-1.44]